MFSEQVHIGMHISLQTKDKDKSLSRVYTEFKLEMCHQ